MGVCKCFKTDPWEFFKVGSEAPHSLFRVCFNKYHFLVVNSCTHSPMVSKVPVATCIVELIVLKDDQIVTSSVKLLQALTLSSIKITHSI